MTLFPCWVRHWGQQQCQSGRQSDKRHLKYCKPDQPACIKRNVWGCPLPGMQENLQWLPPKSASWRPPVRKRQCINAIVITAVHNLADNANGLVEYMNEKNPAGIPANLESVAHIMTRQIFIEGARGRFRGKDGFFYRLHGWDCKSVNTISCDRGRCQWASFQQRTAHRFLYPICIKISKKMDENFPLRLQRDWRKKLPSYKLKREEEKTVQISETI